jgi:putative acetyltransferase
MESVVIREAKKEDYQHLMKLYNAFVGDGRYNGPEDDSFEEVMESGKNFVYVAEEMGSGNLVGFASFSVRTVIRYPRPIAEMDELYVTPAFRGKKIGRKLIEGVLLKASELGCYRMFIETHYDHDVAHKVYEKMQFTNYGYHFIKDL